MESPEDVKNGIIDYIIGGNANEELKEQIKINLEWVEGVTTYVWDLAIEFLTDWMRDHYGISRDDYYISNIQKKNLNSGDPIIRFKEMCKIVHDQGGGVVDALVKLREEIEPRLRFSGTAPAEYPKKDEGNYSSLNTNRAVAAAASPTTPLLSDHSGGGRKKYNLKKSKKKTKRRTNKKLKKSKKTKSRKRMGKKSKRRNR